MRDINKSKSTCSVVQRLSQFSETVHQRVVFLVLKKEATNDITVTEM